MAKRPRDHMALGKLPDKHDTLQRSGNNNGLDEQYYADHIGVVHSHIEKAGIRLAGELNRLLDNTDAGQTVNK
jgi:hypothetical protein